MKLMLSAVLATLIGMSIQTQQDPLIDKAQRILDLMREGKFQEVTADFDAQMAANPPDRLAQVWASMKLQFGELKDAVARRIAPVGDFRAVTIVCKFEKSTLDMVVAFNAGNKIVGLNFTNPRPPENTPSATAHD